MKTIGVLDKTKPWLDFSSLSLFMRCPRAYWWRHVQHIETVKKNALINGTAYHHAKAIYYQAKMKGMSHEDSKTVACLSMIDIMNEIVEPEPKHTLACAQDTIATYLDSWKDEMYQTVDVEIGFAVDLINLIFVGKIDRIVNSPMGIFIEETKTTSIVGNRWADRLKPNLQIDGYVAGYYLNTGVMPGAILDVIPIHEDARKRKPPFRYITVRDEQDIDRWIKCIQQWWEVISNTKYPMNTESCAPLVGFSCNYSQLCNLHPTIDACEALEIPEIYQRSVWTPYELTSTGNGGN